MPFGAGILAACTLVFDPASYGGGSPSAPGDAGPAAEASVDAEARPDAAPPAGDAFIVVTGGATDTDQNVLSTAVYAAKVGADGELGPWTTWTDGRALPEGRHRGALVAARTTLSFVGGSALGGSRASTYQAQFDPDAAFAWTTAQEPLPAPLTRHGAVRSGAHLYVTGGRATGGSTTTSVLQASLDDEGVLGPFLATASLPSPRELHVTVAHGAFLWVLTGYDSATAASFGDGWVADVGSDGALGAFRAVTPLPGGLTINTGSGVATEDHLYVIGGYGSAGNYGRTLSARYRATDGTIESWSEPAQLMTPRSSHASLEVDGRLYAIGGRDAGGALLASVEVATILADGALSSWKATTPLPVPLVTHSAALVRR